MMTSISRQTMSLLRIRWVRKLQRERVVSRGKTWASQSLPMEKNCKTRSSLWHWKVHQHFRVGSGILLEFRACAWTITYDRALVTSNQPKRTLNSFLSMHFTARQDLDGGNHFATIQN